MTYKQKYEDLIGKYDFLTKQYENLKKQYITVIDSAKKNSNTKKIKLEEGYILKTGYNTEKNRKFFFIDITKNGENIFYDSELIKDSNNAR